MKTMMSAFIFVLFSTVSVIAANPIHQPESIVVLPKIVIKSHQQNLIAQDAKEISYAYANLKIVDGPLTPFAVDHRMKESKGIDGLLVTTANAAEPQEELSQQRFQDIYASIDDAVRLSDLKALLADGYFESLKDKVGTGISQYMVLAMLQSMRPKYVQIRDSHIESTLAEFAVVGRSPLGDMQGLIHMIKKDGSWKMLDESWKVAGDDPVKSNSLMVKEPLTTSPLVKYGYKMPVNIISDVSPDFKLRNGFLSLRRVSQPARKESLNFVFLMNKDASQAAEPKDQLDMKKRARMHLMWTGSAKLVPKQKMITDKYLMDFSLARFDDGYASDEWNLVLPNKKPREIVVSLLWTF